MKMNQDNFSNELEESLKTFKKEGVPQKIDYKIQAGLEKGKNRRKRWDNWKNSGLSAVAACILFILSVNFIPGFSNLAGKVPGLDGIVERVKYDDGLKDAVENEYVQVIDKSVTRDGITFTVDHIIVDKSRLILFYTLTREESNRELAVRGTSVMNEKGKRLNNSVSAYGGRLSFEEKEFSGRLDFSWRDEVHFTDKLTLTFQVEEFYKEHQDKGELIEKPFSITFPIDQSKIEESKTYEINQTQSISGQLIHFKKLVSYPTREVLYVEFDQENDMRFLNFYDLHLENEKGEIVSSQEGAQTSGNERKIYLTGKYFKDHEALYIVLTKASALDKNNQQVVVDLQEEELIKAPDHKLTLFGINRNQESFPEEDLALHFKVDLNGADENITTFGLSRKFEDATGKEYSYSVQSSSKNDYFIYLEDKNYQNPLTFDINQYPKFINGDIRIRVK
ncbi:DUF4179 domain-containing protein [Pontibacillus sp. HMF3514]|uniref:DUF4179 domain-containing protein n=1 Tax=Pontibacillus sp. HMF3514 TaxID=2692425 RepID=UPI0013205302|nr:DUF4179 domain-containing protein [Pontibacillus sp. HMF3514]QHE53362.1 DUF4179 domain-containing protein [Pontibacillus sp. HMF3514]